MKEIITTSQAPAAIGPYSQAVKVNNLLFVSGQLGIDPATGGFSGNTVTQQSEQAFQNLNAILKAAGTSMENVVKITVYLTDMATFGELNEVYARQFNEDFPARSAIAVRELPKQGLVEIEAIATL